MTTLVDAIKNQEGRTQNNMKARKSSADSIVDLFYKIGASRGKNITAEFVAAYVENEDLALRVAAWARDVRGGAGERKLFRDILNILEKQNPDHARALANKVPELGRWDDLLTFDTQELREYGFDMIKVALEAGNGLCAKWMPRKGDKAVQLRTYFGWTPKFYRKRLVELTNVVETQMCNNEWDNIDFNKVPSLASSRYKKAFERHTPRFSEYVAKLTNKEKGVKVNAGAVYPYDVLRTILNNRGFSVSLNSLSKTELDHIIAQWEALENFVGDKNVLAMVDVSSSMTCAVGGQRSTGNTLRCIDVALSLGLYLADKNTGKFKDALLTFTSSPKLYYLKGNIINKLQQMIGMEWPGSTNLHAAFSTLLATALKNDVPNEEMPKNIVIFSDMQFNQCMKYDNSAIEMIERKYKDSGYDVPKVIFWNLNSYSNVPVKFDSHGTALVSGFSPSIMKGIFREGIKAEDFTPEKIMLDTIMSDRYAVI